ncbi:MAG TPA: pyridoxine 5'-phosphate synthase [Candidatus Eisenbacteria bacterium]
MACELSVNVDHVATLRQARGGAEPDPARAAELALGAGAAGITIHLREDRRHIQDHDVQSLRALCTKAGAELNLEMALTEEMLGIACAVKPERVTLVPERRAELTTEGGLDLASYGDSMARGAARLRAAGISLSLFLDPEAPLAPIAHAAGAAMVEIHTGAYSNVPDDDAGERELELERIANAARAFEKAGLAVHAGHGLTVRNVGALLRRYPFTELSIGHTIVSRSVEVGMAQAVREMLEAMRLT